MASNFLVPTPDFRSPVAAPGQSGMRDDHVYSAVLVGHGSAASVNAFAQGQGGPIQSMGTVTGATASQTTFSLTTTNLSQSGVVGSNIGDIGIREIGIQVQQAYAAGASTGLSLSATGADQQGMVQITSKMSYQLNLVNKPMNQGPLFAYPSPGGTFGSTAVASTSATQAGIVNSVVSNGVPGKPRRLEVVLAISRIDTIQAIFAVGAGDTLSFTNSANPTLLWNVFYCNVAADLMG